MTWPAVADALGLACLLAGALSCLTSAVGLLRLPDLFSRMHAGAKPQALGVLLMLLGVGLRLRSGTDVGMLLLVGIFQLMTIPVSSHLIARAQHRLGAEVPEGSSSCAQPGEDDAGHASSGRDARIHESGTADSDERTGR